MSLASQVGLLAVRVGNYLRDSVVPRLLPSGGTTGQVLQKVNGTNYNTMWATAFDGAYNSLSGKPTLGTGASVNISVGTTAPSSPSVGDIWIDTN